MKSIKSENNLMAPLKTAGYYAHTLTIKMPCQYVSVNVCVCVCV